MTHRHITPMQAEQIERDRRHLLRKITSGADGRMRERTAKEQLAAAQRELERGPDEVIPDADDSSLRGVVR